MWIESGFGFFSCIMLIGMEVFITGYEYLYILNGFPNL